MRKPFWISWILLLLAFAGSHLRSAAVEYHLTKTTWIQAATAGGGVRLIVLCGDPSASWTAGTVIERDKDVWRYGLTVGSIGYVGYHLTADLEGTPVDTYRIDLPLLPVLLALLGLAIAIWALKRWGAPPQLIWEECRRKRRESRLAGALRTVLLCVFIALSAITTFLWIGGHANLPQAWSYHGDQFAFATAKRSSGFPFDILGDSALTFEERIDQRVAEIKARRERPWHHVGVEILPGYFAFRYFRGDVPAGTTAGKTQYGIAGFSFGQERVAAPTLETWWPTMPFAMPGLTLGLERTVTVPAWALLALLMVWPLWCFFRGPLRRARRRVMGCCRQCGYNLTGLVQPRCPECGEAVEAVRMIEEEHSEEVASHYPALGK